MESFLSGHLDKVLIGTNAGSFKSLRAQLFILVGDKMDAKREIVDFGTLASEIKNLDLGVGHTTVEPGLGIRLLKARSN